MYTRQYRGFYINGRLDQPETRVVFAQGGEVLPGYRFKSYRAAQLFITRIQGL
jgi:hypothetical protein